MSSRHRQNKRQRDENHSPAPLSVEDMVYSMWKSLGEKTSLIIAEIRYEIRAINRKSIDAALKGISKRLSKLESDVRRFDLPHQDMVDNFDYFRQQLARTQHQVMGSESEPGQDPASKGTLHSCLGDLGTQMSAFTERMDNVEENLQTLEDQLFGRSDGNGKPEAGYVMVKIHNESDFRLKLKPNTMIELTQMVQAHLSVEYRDNRNMTHITSLHFPGFW